MRHPYQRLRSAVDLPEVGISEEDSIRSLHLGSPTIQSSMNLDDPTELVLSYSRAMMAWLLFKEASATKHITQIGLGGGSFARWLDAFLPDTEQLIVEINPHVINIAKSMFEIPYETENFHIVEADGADYIKVLRGSTNVIMVDGFDDTQIVDALVEEAFFINCKKALSDDGIFITNWWSGDKRYQQFIELLKCTFPYVLEVPAESHGNIAVMALKEEPKPLLLDALKKRAHKLSESYPLDFMPMFHAIKTHNNHNGKKIIF